MHIIYRYKRRYHFPKKMEYYFIDFVMCVRCHEREYHHYYILILSKPFFNKSCICDYLADFCRMLSMLNVTVLAMGPGEFVYSILVSCIVAFSSFISITLLCSWSFSCRFVKLGKSSTCNWNSHFSIVKSFHDNINLHFYNIKKYLDMM